MIRHKDYLLVKLIDAEARRFKMEAGMLRTFRTKDEESWVNDYPLPEGTWQIIGRASRLSEEQWREIVERWDSGKYNDYERHLARVDTATDSGQSLLRSLNLNANQVVILKLIQP